MNTDPRVDASKDFKGSEFSGRHSNDNSFVSKVFLQPWEECSGILKEMLVDDLNVILVLGQTHGSDLGIVFPVDAPEGEAVNRKVNGGMMGQKIAVLRVEDSANPICIRSVK